MVPKSQILSVTTVQLNLKKAMSWQTEMINEVNLIMHSALIEGHRRPDEL